LYPKIENENFIIKDDDDDDDDDDNNEEKIEDITIPEDYKRIIF
jgi:hypothetical protein